MDKPRVLIADDKENMLTMLTRMLGEAYSVVTVGEGSRAIAHVLAGSFDVVVSDIRMPGADGFEVLKAVKEHAPETEVVLMTAYGSIEKAVEAMKLGAYDYITKPFDPDEVALVIARAVERKRLKEQASTLKKALDGVYAFHNLVGRSQSMRAVYGLLERAATSDIGVLLLGETGTGKELAARAIHHHSSRKDRPFVAINCGALPAELVESELFGYAKGAFTGAAAARSGLFEEAHGGTLFLDEIGDVPLSVQVKLNRALQEKEIRRVGENTPIAVDVRVIAATNRDLKQEVESGHFREDLFYRLHVLSIRLPALRERREDIPVLAAHFLERASRVHGRSIEGFEPDALRALIGHAWPGNVRELENTIERAVAVSSGTMVTLSDLPPEVQGPQQGEIAPEVMIQLPYREAVERARDRISREYLLALMREFQGNVTRAAERAGMERESLHRLLRRYRVRSEDFKPRN